MPPERTTVARRPLPGARSSDSCRRTFFEGSDTFVLSFVLALVLVGEGLMRLVRLRGPD